MSKVVANVQEALKGIESGMTVMIGGFGCNGVPENTVKELAKMDVNNLTTISCTANVDDFGLGLLLKNRQVKKVIGTYLGENKIFEEQTLNKEIEVEMVPQGTLAERIRVAGVGIPAFYTPTGVGTEVAQGKESKFFNGREYLMEEAIHADFAFVKAWKGDAQGNLVFRNTANNYNALMAMAGKITIAEVEEIVPVGSIDPNYVHTPGIFVQRIFKGEFFENYIEFLTTRD